MKQIIINENMLRRVVAEMLKEQRQMLNEISTRDAYERFYKATMPKEVYYLLMRGTEKMTPFHKSILDAYPQDIDSETAIETAKAVSNFWQNLSPEGKQYAITYLAGRLINWRYLPGILEAASKKKYYTEANYISNGFVILRDDDKVMVSCTLSYAASRKYFGDSKWCTASDIGGRRNGYEMFRDYTDGCCLIQFIPKNNRHRGIQVAFDSDGVCNAACNFEDKGIRSAELKLLLTGVMGIDEEGVTEFLNSIDYKGLVDKTRDFIDEEAPYWYKKTKEYQEKMEATLIKDVNNGGYDGAIKEALDKIDFKRPLPFVDVFFDNNGTIQLSAYPSSFPSNSVLENASASNGYVFEVEIFGKNQKEVDWLYSIRDHRIFKLTVIVSEDKQILSKYWGKFACYKNIVVVSNMDANGQIDKKVVYRPTGAELVPRVYGSLANFADYGCIGASTSQKEYAEATKALFDTTTGEYLGKTGPLFKWKMPPKKINEAKKNHRPPKTVAKAILKANRDMDIEDHGKPTAFRKTMTKNPKAYTRKIKHKGDLS